MRKNRVLAIIMAVLMMVTLLPSMVFAAEVPSGALDGTLKIKGSASVGSTLSADLSQIKPTGVTSEYVSFSWSLKDGDLLTEVGTGKSYKVDEKAQGLPIVLKITGKEDKGITGSLTATSGKVAVAKERKSSDSKKKETKSEETSASAEKKETETADTSSVDQSDEKQNNEAQNSADQSNVEQNDDAQNSDDQSNVEQDDDAQNSNDQSNVEQDNDAQNSDDQSGSEETEEPTQNEDGTDSQDSETTDASTEEKEQTTENTETPAETKELTYSATVSTEDGSGVINFGSVEEDYTEVPEAQYVSITNNGTGDLNFKSLAPEHFMVQDINGEPLKAGETTTAFVQPREGIAAGEYKDTITYETEEGVKVSFEADFTVTAKKEDTSDTEEKSDSEETQDPEEKDDQPETPEAVYKLGVDNSELSFETLKEGYENIEETCTVTVRNEGTAAVTLIQPASDYFGIAPATSVETDGDIQLEAGGEQTFTVQPKLGLSAQDDPYTEELVFSTKEDKTATVAVNVQVSVEKDASEEVPSVSVDTSNVDFGSLEQGYGEAPETQTITLTNTGKEAIRLDQPTADNYEVGTISAEVINPGESATFTLQPKTGLAAGDYNEKISVKDVDGNELAAVEVIFAVTEPQPVYDLSIDPESLEFDSSEEGYKDVPAEQTVTVTNTGNTSITLQQPESKYYTVGNLSETEIAAGSCATFTVQPKSGLTKGEYLEDISVPNSGNVECYVNAHFSVTKKTDDNSNNLTGIKKPSDITDIPNGTEKSQKALKLPSTVKITTTKGEQKAKVKWDVKGCSYNPASVDRQTFNVKGTVTLPDGVKNPDNISTVIAVSITVNAYKGTEVKESENKITGIDANGKYDTNSKITFTAVGAGMNNESPKKGDTRYLPGSWKITETRTWDAAPYTATFRVSKAGQYTLSVTFKQQKYNGSKWENTGSESSQKVTFKVSQAATVTTAATATPKPKPTVTGTNKKSAVQTGDNTPVMTFVIILVAAVACIGGVVVYKRKKK